MKNVPIIAALIFLIGGALLIWKNAQWTVYRDDVYGFSVSYPHDWSWAKEGVSDLVEDGTYKEFVLSDFAEPEDTAQYVFIFTVDPESAYFNMEGMRASRVQHNGHTYTIAYPQDSTPQELQVVDSLKWKN